MLRSHLIEQLPLTATLSVTEEIEEDHFVELKSLSLVHGETKHIFEEVRNGGFALLVTHYDDPITTELVFLALRVFSLCFLLGRLIVSTPDQVIVQDVLEGCQ